MLYKERYTFSRINQDLAPDKRDTSTHLNIVNMEVFLTSRGASLQVAKGPLAFPDPSSLLANLTVIGHGHIDDDLYIFVTDESKVAKDAILKVEVTDTQLNLYLIKDAFWGFDAAYPISAIGARESESSEKLYWIDALNQARFINVLQPTEDVNYVLSNSSPAIITAIPYAITASKNAVVRYGYTQYNVGGSESKLSPLTGPINISTEGDSAEIHLTGLTSLYNTYRIYRVMWEAYKAEPTYAIVAEGTIDPTSSVVVRDGGGLYVTGLSIEEFLDIGSDLLVPSTLISKKQRLFFGNYKIEPFTLNDDVRAFSYAGGALTLGDPISIPPDTNLEYSPTIDGVLTRATLKDSLDDGVLREGTISESTPFYVTINTLTFYIRSTTSARYDAEIFDYNDTTYSDPVGYMYIGGATSAIQSVSNISVSGLGYRLRIIQIRPTIDPEPIGILWDSKVDSKVEFYVGHNDVPDIGGKKYSGVTGFIDTTEAKFRDSAGTEYSDYTTVNTVIPNALADKDQLQFVFVGGLFVNGMKVPEGSTVYPFLRADLYGTYQELEAGVGVGIELTDAENSATTVYSSYNSVPVDIDAVNADREVNIYQSDLSTLGAEGRVVKLSWAIVNGGESHAKYRRFKAGEVYRIAVVFYDDYGRTTAAMWVADLLAPYATSGDNVTGYRNFYNLEGEVKVMPEGAVGFKFVHVKREVWDKSVLFQGIVQPVMAYSVGSEPVGIYPFPTAKEVKGNGASNVSADFSYFDVRAGYNPNTKEDFPGTHYSPTFSEAALHDTRVNMVYTPDTFLYNTDMPGNRVKIIGTQEIIETRDSTRMEFNNPSNDTVYRQTYKSIQFNMESASGYNMAPSCLFDSYTDDDDENDSYALYMYYREGGEFHACTHKTSVLSYCKYLGIDSTVSIDSSVVSNVIDQLNFAGKVSDEKCNYQAEHADCFLINTDSTTWAGTPNYADFLVGSSLGGSDRAFPIVDVMQVVSEQYGGSSIEARSRNTYVDSSQGVMAAGTKVTLFGDIYNGVYYLPKSTSARSVTDGHSMSVFDYIKVGLEAEVSMSAANKVLRDINGNLDGATANNLKVLEVKNLLKYENVFSQIPSAVISVSKPFNYVEILHYINRITVSNSKYGGEVVDNWTKINLGTYMDLETQYGSIIELIRSKDNVFAFQGRGIAYISIYPEKQIQTNTGGLQLAKGSVLDNFQYVSTESGSENKQAIAVYDDDVYYIDTVNKTLNTLKQSEVSTLKGFNHIVKHYMKRVVKDYLSPSNPDGGFVVVNNDLKQVLFKFSSEFPMLAYNYITGQFTNSRSYPEYYFLSFNNYVLGSIDSKLYIHDKGAIGEYCGEAQPATIEMFIEPLPGVDKVFDAVITLKEGVGNFDKVRVVSPTRVSGEEFSDLVFKSKYDIHTAYLPRVENSRDRWRERNIKIALQYNGSESLEVDEIFIKFSVKK